MIDMIWNFVSFVVALGILVTIHEYGHFWVARKLGVKVLTFSVGFGKPILQKIGKDGVRYVIAAIPLGGYVKMLDEREYEDSDISEEDKPFAFNRKPVWARMAIVLAGPVANFILAIVLYWWMFILGVNGLIPVVGDVPENTIAFEAGLKKDDLILAIDGEPIITTQDLVEGLVKRLGDKTLISLSVKRKGFTQPQSLSLNIAQWKVNDEKPEILKSLGIYNPLEVLSTQLNDISPQGAADKAGLQVGDVITQIDTVTVNKWRELVSVVESIPNKSTMIQVDRKGELMNISVVIGSQEDNGKLKGLLGVRPKAVDPTPFIITQKVGVLDALVLANQTAYKKIILTVQLFKKLLIGDISHKSISGPFSIAKGAGTSASYGLVAFLSFLAMISVNLGFINLLPVPMLDGGHLLYFTIEAIKGKPLSQKMQEFGLQIGMMLVFLLMAVAIYNDIVVH